MKNQLSTSLCGALGVALLLGVPSRGRAENDLNAATAQAFHARSWEAARTLADSAWAVYEKSGDPARAAIAAANLGGVYAIYGRLEEAASFQEKAREFLGGTKNGVLVGKLARARAITAFLDSRQFGNMEPEKAIAEMGTALELLEPSEVEPCHAEVLGQSGQGNRVQDGYIKYLGLISAVEG